MPIVMLIDDDQEAMKYYILAIKQEGFELVHIKNPDETISYFNKPTHEKPDIVILDIMLPPGEVFANYPDVDEGLRSGILLYRRIKDQCENIPFVVLTNLRNPQTISDLKDLSSDILIFHKDETTPFDLTDHIKGVISP